MSVHIKRKASGEVTSVTYTGSASKKAAEKAAKKYGYTGQVLKRTPASKKSSSSSSSRSSSSSSSGSTSSSAISNASDEKITVVFREPGHGTQHFDDISRSEWERIKSKEGYTEVAVLPSNATKSQIAAASSADIVRVARSGGGGTYFSKAELQKAGYSDDATAAQKQKVLSAVYQKQFKTAPKSTYVLRRDYDAYVQTNTGEVVLSRKGSAPFRSTPTGWVKAKSSDMSLGADGNVEVKYAITSQEKLINTSKDNYGETGLQDGPISDRGGLGDSKEVLEKNQGKQGLFYSGSGDSGGDSSLFARSSRPRPRPNSETRDGGGGILLGSEGGDGGSEKRDITEEVGQATSSSLFPAQEVDSGEFILSESEREKDIRLQEEGKSYWEDAGAKSKMMMLASQGLSWSVLSSPFSSQSAKSAFFEEIGEQGESVTQMREEGKSDVEIALRQTAKDIWDSPLSLAAPVGGGKVVGTAATKVFASKAVPGFFKTSLKAGGAGLTGLWGASVAEEVASADPKDRPEIIVKEILSAAAFAKGAQKGISSAKDAITFKPTGEPIITGRELSGGKAEYRLWQRLKSEKGETREDIYSIITKPSKKKGVSDYEVTKIYEGRPAFEAVERGKSRELASMSKDLNTQETSFKGSRAGFIVETKDSKIKLKKDLTLSESLGLTSEGRITRTKSLTDAMRYGRDRESLFEVTANTKIASPKTKSDEWAHMGVTYPQVEETKVSKVVGVFSPKAKSSKSSSTKSSGSITEQVTKTTAPSVPGEAIIKVKEDIAIKGVQTYNQPKTASKIVKASASKIVSASPVIGIKPSEETAPTRVLNLGQTPSTRVVEISKSSQETTPLMKDEELEAISSSSLTDSLTKETQEKKTSSDEALSSLGAEGRSRVIELSPHRAQIEGTRTIEIFSKDKLEGKKVFRPQLSAVTNITEQKEREKREMAEAAKIIAETKAKSGQKGKSLTDSMLKSSPASRQGQRVPFSATLLRTSQQSKQKSTQKGMFSYPTSGKGGAKGSTPRKYMGIPGLDLNLPQSSKQEVIVPRRRRKGKVWVEKNPVGSLFDKLWGKK